MLTECGVLHKPVLYLSHYFKQHRQAYYEHLQGVRDRGDWEAWLIFFLRGVIAVAGEAASTARNILQLREQHRLTITEHLSRSAGNGHRIPVSVNISAECLANNHHSWPPFHQECCSSMSQTASVWLDDALPISTNRIAATL